MMKNIAYKNIGSLFVLITLFLVAWGGSSCKDDDDGSNSPATITKVYLEDAKSSVTDREVAFARIGQLLRLEGSGFTGVQKVYFNGKSATFNPALATDNNLFVQIPDGTPIIDAAPDVLNTIIMEKGGTQYEHPFEIRAAAPAITSISHTMPQAGDVITIYGTGLQGVKQVLFPGNIEGTNITSDNEDGRWCLVTVPAGITTSGSITVIGANGGAYSPAYFNYKEGLLHNFDDVQNYNWGSGIDNTALTAVIPSSAGNSPKSQGGYQCFNADGNLAAGNVQKFWLNSSPVMDIMGKLPASTPTDQCGIQMDIYVDGAWNSGIIRYVAADGWGNDRYCMLYQPVYPNGTSYNATAFVNPGCWFTITLPFSLSADFTDKTLGDVIAQMGQASYMQTGPFFENSGIKDVFDPVAATEKIYFDNIRIVPLSAPAYSDFPDEE
ncbi:MAG: glycan-binding surface protein [Candidatus Azobacteroides sp.]|nr:glycan-binding surface protein [Candidatus Azobacteroides sp.]